jgi:putative redox protein
MTSASVLWTREKQFVAQGESGHAIVLDTGAGIGGHNTGPNPMELLLISLAGCTAVDVVFILGDRMKKPLSGVEVHADGERSEQVPKVYTTIELTYLVRGPDLREKDAVRAIRLSAEKYCSVSAMLSRTAQIKVRYEVTDETTGEVSQGTLNVEHG